MMHLLSILGWRRALGMLLVGIAICGSGDSLQATDYFLTVAGGYEPEGNQASLEANVIFFQQILAENHNGPLQHRIFFADGDDPEEDLQVLVDQPVKSNTPATDLIATLHRQDRDEEVTYRNHRVPGVEGPLDPKLVRAALETLAKTTRRGDRLIIFVTAHGSEGKEEDEFNTTIDCWDDKTILAREFVGWLDKLPTELPVVMVMAQCYCGGFSHTIFEDLNDKKEVDSHLRAGFFAQQHDLPAAGCRPDIEHDEEFSSYFWGAIAGRSRNGVPITGVDADGNGVVSFAEAYAHAVIPLRTSEVFLERYSKLPVQRMREGTEEGKASAEAREDARLFLLEGKLETLMANSRPVSARIVKELAKTLNLSLQDDVAQVKKSYDEIRRADRTQGRGGRSRQGSGRRDLLREVTEKWPELGDEDRWDSSKLLRADNQEPLLAELKQLPSWKSYEERRQQRLAADKVADQREIRSVKFRRLLSTLEAIVREKNLPLVATPEIVKRYEQLMALEEMALDETAKGK